MSGAYRKTVVGVVCQGSEILVIKKQHWNGWVDFPQGGIEEGESPEEAVLRELAEELGTDRFGKPVATGITVTRPFSPETLAHYPDRGNVGKEQHYFVVPFMGNREDIRLGDDLVAYRWLATEDLLKKIYDPATTEKVLEFMREKGLLS